MIDMVIQSELITKIVKKLIERELMKNLGNDAQVDFIINNLKVDVKDGKTSVSFDGSLNTDTKSIYRLLTQKLHLL